MEMLEESLKSFGRAAAGMMDDWLSSVPMGEAVMHDADAAQRTISDHIVWARGIGTAAGAAGLAGLEAVCAMIETNLLILQDNELPLRSEMRARLEELPSLVFSYWAEHASNDSRLALLSNLTAAWPLPLAEEAVAEEMRRLMAPQGDGRVSEGVRAPASAPAALPTGTQQVDRAMLAIMRQEFDQVREQLSLDLAALAPDAPEHDRQTALDAYTEMLQRLGMAVDTVGLGALGALLAQLAKQVAPPVTAQQQSMLQPLPDLVAAYFECPTCEENCVALADTVANPAWVTPNALYDPRAWAEALADVAVRDDAPREDMPPMRVTAEDLSLELPDDVNSELLEGLLQELPVHTSAFTAAIQSIANGDGSMKDMERAMRAAHTLKGAANTVGVRGIANLTHHLEDILVALMNAERMPGDALASLLVQASDCLEAMSEVLLGVGDPPELSQEIMQQVLDCANGIERGGVESVEARAAEADATETARGVEGQIVGQSAAETPISTPAPAPEHTLRVPASVVDELLRLAGETLISTSQIHEHVRLTAGQSTVIRQQSALIQQLVAELEELVDIRGIASAQREAKSGSDFDALEFEHYSELHTVTHRLIEAATDARELADESERQVNALEEVLHEQRRLQMANQHTVMRTRMIPVSTIAPRLQRSVRQTARLLDKNVQLTIKGENTNIDGQVLHDLMDPLMHLLRNAVDHGIEAPEDRIIAGKPAAGHIELSFAREGNSIVVRCSDDGAGLDYGAIRRMAERKGLLTPGREHPDQELARLILAPGFSTRSETSQVSGRGVGMDVVHSRIQELKGLLGLFSSRGKGLTVELRLPSTLLSTHTLIVRQRDKRLAVSSRGVEDIRYVSREEIRDIGPRQFYQDGEQLLSLVKLETLLAMPADRRAKDRHGFPVLFTRMTDGTLHPVLVQEIVDSREVVMKNFGRYVPRTHGVVGAVILGDGGVVPVIDLVDLLGGPREQWIAGNEAEKIGPSGMQAEARPLCALVVDDSLSARRAITQVMKDAGFDVRVASDGLEAATMLQRFVPDIILTDLEMPRMNGLELTAHVRGAERTRQVPVIMITSRSTEKHRQAVAASGVSAHLTKPFNDEALLRQIMSLMKR